MVREFSVRRTIGENQPKDVVLTETENECPSRGAKNAKGRHADGYEEFKKKRIDFYRDHISQQEDEIREECKKAGKRLDFYKAEIEELDYSHFPEEDLS